MRGSQAPSVWEVRPPADISSPEVPAGWTTAIAGRTVQGRDIAVFVRAVDAPRRRVLVIGGLHGNEPITPPAVRGLLHAAIAPDVEVWLVPVANPDGSAAGMRCNANGVDLNRNFPWEWRGRDGGPAPLSEPETQALVALVEQLQPDVVIWVHQPLGYVSAIGETSSALEQAWADAAGIPVRPDVTQHGGGESWSAFVAGVPSMLIEIAGWAATPELVADTRAGVEAVLVALG
jgi:protein MpaA